MPASEVVTKVGDRTLTLTNLDKVLYPATGYTKAEVINYYLQIAPTMLPYVADRALTRLRFPDGVGADRFSFYEKNAPMGTPAWVRRAQVGTSDGIIDYVVADDQPTLVWLANLAALELHVPQWTIGSARPGRHGVVDLPELDPRGGEPLANRVVVDLDPGRGHVDRRERPRRADRGRPDGRGRTDPGPPDLGEQGNPGVRRGRAGAEQGRLVLRQAAQRHPGQGVPRLLHRHHVGRAASGPDLRRLQPEPGGPQHHRAVLDAWP